MDDVIEIKVPDPDSQFRLIPCKCGSDNVAYEHYNGRGGAAWRYGCLYSGSGTTTSGCRGSGTRKMVKE